MYICTTIIFYYPFDMKAISSKLEIFTVNMHKISFKLSLRLRNILKNMNGLINK